MNLKALGLASLQRSIAQQESWPLWLAEGDTPTKFFHIQASTRRRKKFIKSLKNDGTVHFDEDAKANIAFNFFNSLLGTSSTRSHSIDLGRIGLPSIAIASMDDRFTEQ